MTLSPRLAAAVLLFMFTPSPALLAQSSLAGETLRISRAAGPIKIDGNLSDEGWQGVKPLTTWYEVNPGDNTPPTVRNVGRITYDDRFLYAAFEFDDPNPRAIRAPYSDRDDSGDGFYDFGGIVHRCGPERPHRQAVRGHAAQHPIRLDHRRRVRRGHVTRLLLGVGDEDHRARMDARDAHPVHVAPVQEQRPADVGHPALPQLSARP